MSELRPVAIGSPEHDELVAKARERAKKLCPGCAAGKALYMSVGDVHVSHGGGEVCLAAFIWAEAGFRGRSRT